MAGRPRSITRRQFIRRSGEWAAGAGLACGAPLLAQSELSPVASQPHPPGRRPKSVVVRVRSEFVASAPEIQVKIMTEMFESALLALTKAPTVGQAWGRLLRADDVIGIKFDPCGQSELSTAAPFAALLFGSLIQAGWPAERIIAADAPEAALRQFDLRPAQLGWSADPVTFGGASDQLAAFLDPVTAIINVPFLKDDNITGLSGCLKNVTYHLLKHPGRYHANGGSPYLADLYALPQISGKLRLNLMNALRTVYNKGPLVAPEFIDHTGLLLMGLDPIAVDAVAIEALNAVRSQAGLPPLPISVQAFPSLFDAAAKGLGHVDFRMIERVNVVYP